MKLRKTRIKQNTKANGAKEYFPQYKGWIFWNDFYSWDSSDHDIWKITAKWLDTKASVNRTEEEAKELIDFYIARVKHKQACKIENKVVKIEYEDYPW